ncbi:MAG: hypothetical protein IJ086_00705 [Clostridium sp.]|nr:hypothetical protein [Clostridium sp.]
MKYEMLSERHFNENFGDFKECETLWTEVPKDVVDIILSVSYRENANVVKKDMQEGKAIKVFVGFIRIKTESNKCPLCASSFKEPYAALSIVDNKTRICPDCGIREQLESYTGVYDR